MKKLLSLVLVALMVVPFCVMASADAPPAEPQAADDVPTIYCADSAVPSGATAIIGSATNDPEGIAGTTATQVLKTTAEANKKILHNKSMLGAKLVWVGKAYFNSLGNEFPETAKPVVFTSNDGTTDFISRDADGNILYMKEDGSNAGQFGMIMLEKGISLIFNGDVIFETNSRVFL